MYNALHNKVATVFGGTGFIGRQIVRELARRGVTVKVATRVPERAYFLRPNGTVGQIVPLLCDYNDPESINAAVAGSHYVVNCIGILFERRASKFKKAHTDIPEAIARACAKTGVECFVHVSALNVENNKSRYAQSKLDGERAVLKAFPAASILRPSIVFGPDDNFFNKFAALMRVLPVLPLIGGGKTKFQPVYVGDVADAAMACLGEGGAHEGKIYELGGPDILTFKDIYEVLFFYTGRRRPFITLPFWYAKLQAFFMEFLPSPLLTRDQVESLKSDYTVGADALGFKELGIQPKAMDLILPRYLSRFRDGGRFAGFKKAA